MYSEKDTKPPTT